MKALKGFYELIRKTYGPFFPTSRKKKGEFLERVRDKVKYYKPRIEERCEISLGDVKVKDNKFWLSDVAYGSAYKRAVENAWKKRRIPTKIDFHASFMVASVVEAIMFGPIGLYNVMDGADFREHNGTIYAPFNYMNRFMDIDFNKRTERLDYVVIHELSHTLWEKISGEIDGHLGEGRKWFEGFATYCADNYFADFYPKGTEKVIGLSKVYTEGKERIEKLVAKYGTQILLEVPKKWEEFANNSS